MMERTAEQSSLLADQATHMAQRASTRATACIRDNPWLVTGGALATDLVLGAAFTGCLHSRSGSGDRAVC
jgi:ElaB/YqjD/DUF883 family membrane-anchored ribosome-binding protein